MSLADEAKDREHRPSTHAFFLLSFLLFFFRIFRAFRVFRGWFIRQHLVLSTALRFFLTTEKTENTENAGDEKASNYGIIGVLSLA